LAENAGGDSQATGDEAGLDRSGEKGESPGREDEREIDLNFYWDADGRRKNGHEEIKRIGEFPFD
jgi:hypothetical protein